MSRPRSAANYGPERGTTYLLHFDRPYRHARHYTGWTTDLKGRLDAHRRGDGSKFMRYVRAAGIRFTLARVWPNTTKDREDSVKHRGGASRFCPECGAVPGTPRLASDKTPEPADRRPMWMADRDGEWADGTPIIYDPDLTWQQARADRAAVQIPEPDPAGREELAALDELERRWSNQEEPEMFGSKARAERRAEAEADRLFALAEELEKQAPPRPNYAREITAERAARMRERLGGDLVQDARAQATEEARTPEPEFQGAERDAEIDRLAAEYPEPAMTFGEEVRLEQGPEAWEALKQQYQQETGAPDPDRDVARWTPELDAPEWEPGEPVFGPRADGTYAGAIDDEILAQQLAAAQEAGRMWAEPHLPQWHAEEAAEMDAAGWYAQVDPEPDGATPAETTGEYDRDAATWSPALEAEGLAAEPPGAAEESLQRDMEEAAADAEMLRRQERAALAREHIAQEARARYEVALLPELSALAAGQGELAAAAGHTAAEARELRREAEADAYASATALQDIAGWDAASEPQPEPMERMSPEAGTPDHQYAAPECAEADPEGAHFGRGPGEPMDAGRWPVLQADYGRMYIGEPQAQAEAS
jgi:predicted GIY-YIG superfamily endonuclease